MTTGKKKDMLGKAEVDGEHAGDDDTLLDVLGCDGDGGSRG